MYKLFKFIFFLIVFQFAFGFVNGQNERRFSKEKIEDFKSKPEFEYFKSVENQADLYDLYKNKVRDFLQAIFGNNVAQGILRNFHYIIMGIALLLIILYFRRLKIEGGIFTNNQSINKLSGVVQELNIDEINFDSAIKQAIDEKNFRLALRFYYLKTLKALNQKELILWEPFKTNYEYINELKDSDLRTRFKELSRVYEIVWYGDKTISESDFTETEKNFKAII